MVPEEELSTSKTTFSQDEINYESGRVSFEQMKVSEKKGRELKNQVISGKSVIVEADSKGGVQIKYVDGQERTLPKL